MAAQDTELQVTGKGQFETILKQSFKQIRDSRAQALIEDTEIVYKRNIEDRVMKIKQMDRSAENILLDLCPTSTVSTTLPSDYNPQEFMAKDQELAMNKRNEIIRLVVAIQRYNILFGEYSGLNEVKKIVPDIEARLKSSILEVID